MSTPNTPGLPDDMGVMVIGPDGIMDMPIPAGTPDPIAELIRMLSITAPAVWPDDKPLPHTAFTDPPGGLSPAEYEEVLRGLATEAPEYDAFVLVMLVTLGRDMVEAHGVTPDRAEAGVTEFARKLWDEAHPTIVTV